MSPGRYAFITEYPEGISGKAKKRRKSASAAA
jgi:hypothetical protein